MNTERRRFAPLGLYLALLAALAAAGLYIVQREWNLPLQISLGLIVVGLALFAVLDPERVRAALTGRQARYGSNALVLTVAFLGILGVANYLVFDNSQRWDLTEDQQFTLAPETIETLNTLPSTVEAQAFFTSRVSPETAQELLEQYKFRSDGKFTYEFIDPEADPIAAEQAGISTDGSIVLYMEDQKQIVSPVSEQEMTGALVRLINPETQTVYFLSGHGEYDPEGAGEQSYAQAKRFLESKNYTVQTLSLLAENRIPEGADLIVIAGPRQPLAQTEVDLLSAYLSEGGALVVMEEPLPVTDFGDAADPLADYLAQDWGVSLGQDIVIDQTSQQPFAPYAAQYGQHPITEKLERVTSVFPTVRSVTANSAVTGVTAVQLVSTAPQSWAETNLADLTNQDAQIGFDAAQDRQGPVSMAVAAENLETQGRVVVFGDADFAGDANIIAYANADLFVNTVDWATQQENQINLTPKQNTQRLLVLPQTLTLNLILLGTVFILPGLALVSGIIVWIQRRRRG